MHPLDVRDCSNSLGDDVKKRVEQIGDCALYLGDCLEILPTLGRVDAVVTDPPYGVDLGNHRGATDTRRGALKKSGYESYNDDLKTFRSVVVPAIERSISISNRSAVFMSGIRIKELPQWNSIGGVYLSAACGRNDWGFASIQHCVFYGKAPNLNLGSKATAIASNEIAEKNGHPVPKPIGWMLWAVDLASIEGHTVLDPFMGSGTTGVACVNLGRKFIGIEIEPKYFDIACKRIDAASRQEKLFKPEPKESTVDMDFS